MKRLIIFFLLSSYIIVLFTCCAPNYNKPLLDDVVDTTTAVAYGDTNSLIIACFSGGGTRAMAMSFYAMQEFNKIEFSDTSNLRTEIDYISSVSGGSFTATAMAVYKDDFDSFEEIVKTNITNNLILKFIMPWNFARCLSPYYSRTNLAEEYYNETIFREKTFKDIKHPVLWINATLLAKGKDFVFNKRTFYNIGSDIFSYPLGYAVTASSAFPAGFTPTTLINYGDSLILDSLLKDRTYKSAFRNASRDIHKQQELNYRNYINNKNNKWLYMQDGGLSGNTGIRRVLDAWATNGVINRALNNNRMKRLIIIVINAGTDKEDDIAKSQWVPHIPTVLGYTLTTAMDVLSDARLSMVEDKIEDTWSSVQQNKDIYKELDANYYKLQDFEKPYLIEISARNLQNPYLKEAFSNLPTSFYLDKEQLGTIKEAVKELLKDNKELKRLKGALNEQIRGKGINSIDK